MDRVNKKSFFAKYIEKTKHKSLEISNFEPIDQEIGVGFHLDKPDSFIYSLLPRQTTTIPISVVSSMWGEYTDLLQLQVQTNRILYLIKICSISRSMVLISSKKFPFKFISLVIR